MSAPRSGIVSRKRRRELGIIWPHEPVIKTEIGTGKFMLRTTRASSRVLRVCIFGLVTTTTAVIFTSAADARRYRQRQGQARQHHVARGSDSPAYSSTIADGKSAVTPTA